MINSNINTYSSDNIDGQISTLNLGPTHPATHGIFQNVLKMDGERIIDATPTIGYIHRAFEKIAERRAYYQITTLTDRLNYCSSPINNIGYQMAVEKLTNIQIPKKVDYMRIILMELARIADHIICNSVIGVDAGALTGFTYIWQWREKIYDIYEEVCGARLTTNMGIIGGFEKDFTPTFHQKLNAFIKEFPKAFKEFSSLLERNRIFVDRCVGAGPISGKRALDYGFTGPNLRATGVDFDIRIAKPYCSYSDFDFDIPIGNNGDTYDRFMVRQEEIWQSFKLIKNALNNIPEGSCHSKDTDFLLPPKEDVYSKMEPLISQFKTVMGENNIRKTEIYNSVEGANGELGFYIISEGGRSPYRFHIRRPCFIYYQAYPEMIKNSLLSDAVLTLSSMNVIAGELDA